MINISLENNLELYKDYEKSLSFLSDIDDSIYNYPDNITYFHVYSEIKNEKDVKWSSSDFFVLRLKDCMMETCP